jgi:predicted metal-binding protein
VAHTCNSCYSRDRDQKDGSSKPAGQIVLQTLSQKILNQSKDGGVSQVVECLPCKREALSSTTVLNNK